MKNIRQKLGVVGGVLGAALVACGYTLEPNMIWCVSNTVLLSYFIEIKEKELAAQMVIYTLIAIYGVITLGILN